MSIISSKEERYNLLWKKWHAERIHKKIICKAIFSENHAHYFKNFKKMKFTSVKGLKGITPSAIDIMGDRVLIFTYENEPCCLSIKNKEIV